MDDYLGCTFSITARLSAESNRSQILIMYYVSYGTSHISSTAAFRLPWGLQIVPASILLICLPMMPRSPRWLATQDRWQEAAETLAIIRSKGDQTDPKFVTEFQEIRERVLYVFRDHTSFFFVVVANSSQPRKEVSSYAMAGTPRQAQPHPTTCRRLRPCLVAI